MIRPAAPAVVPCGWPDDGHNLLDMTVDEIINYGNSILVIGTTKGLTLRARLVGSDAETLQRGMSVTMSWTPTDAHILARE